MVSASRPRTALEVVEPHLALKVLVDKLELHHYLSTEILHASPKKLYGIPARNKQDNQAPRRRGTCVTGRNQ